MKRYKNALFIFNRDLRISDNCALRAAVGQSEQVSCAFVVDPVFNRFPDKRTFAKHFLLSILAGIDKELHEFGGGLHLLSGSYVDILRLYIIENNIDAVFVNREYTKNGRIRLSELQAFMQAMDIDVHVFDDALLFPPGFILKSDGKPYTIFTPFYNKARQFPVEKPKLFRPDTVFSKPVKKNRFLVNQLADYWQVSTDIHDIRKKRIEVLSGLVDCAEYTNQRDFPALQATSGISVHLKFGTISVREAYWAVVKKLGADSPLLRQFYWRDFFNHIGFFFPHVFTSAFNTQFSNIAWGNNKEKFARWCEGNTGFPIVDAGMRELSQTGFMHNRVRMIVASFLVKDLHIDWRWGERYFAEKLIDYDVAVNNGNWQWAASTGCDAQPYFRIFNPWLQQQKFDARCDYIYRWIPELRGFSPKDIHHWFAGKTLCAYPLPIVDHAECSQQAKLFFRQAAELYRCSQAE